MRRGRCYTMFTVARLTRRVGRHIIDLVFANILRWMATSGSFYHLINNTYSKLFGLVGIYGCRQNPLNFKILESKIEILVAYYFSLLYR